MPEELSVEAVVEANKSVKRYHVRLDYGGRFIYEADIDRATGQQYVLLGTSSHQFPEVEAHWEGADGIGPGADELGQSAIRPAGRARSAVLPGG